MEPWRILVVDDEVEIAMQTAEVIKTDTSRLSDTPVSVVVEPSFEVALDLVDSRRIDLLILDVRDQQVAAASEAETDVDEYGSDATGADAGLAVFEKVRGRRFVPVIFFTGLVNLVDETLVRSPFVQLVSKTDPNSTANLRSAVNSVLNSTLPKIYRALTSHVESVTREFMINFVEANWDELKAPNRESDLAHLLLRRLALSLADGGEILSSLLEDQTVVEVAEDNVHPMRFYVMPPVGDLTTGDLIVGPPPTRHNVDNSGALVDLASEGEQSSGLDGEVNDPARMPDNWYVVLTPACDLVPNRIKANYVVLAECVPLESSSEFQHWARTQPKPGQQPTKEAKAAEKALARLMRNSRLNRPADRDYFLPAAWSVPNLIVDFQRISSVKVEDVLSYRRVATIDSPYVHALVETFSRYLGRRGTPDLDTTVTISHLKAGRPPEPHEG